MSISKAPAPPLSNVFLRDPPTFLLHWGRRHVAANRACYTRQSSEDPHKVMQQQRCMLHCGCIGVIFMSSGALHRLYK